MCEESVLIKRKELEVEGKGIEDEPGRDFAPGGGLAGHGIGRAQAGSGGDFAIFSPLPRSASHFSAWTRAHGETEKIAEKHRQEATAEP